MEQRILKRIAQLHETAPDSIGDLFHFQLISWDAAQQCAVLRCSTDSWMRNAAGTLHGGIITAILDQAMGFLAFSSMPGEGIAPSVQLQTVFHRPLIPREGVLVHVRVVSVTKHLMHFSAEAFPESNPKRLSVSGTGVYYFKPTSFER